jgi:hypothetical protein
MYHGGYPVYGTPDYWVLLNDPYYAPNYWSVASPWYRHDYPAGYTLDDDSAMFVPAAAAEDASDGMSALAWTLLGLGMVLILGGVVYLALRRRG